MVEATEKSGSLVTARFAAETGREVFAVPHNLTSRTGLGPNALLQRGAKLVLRASDVLEELPDHLRGALSPVEAAPAATPGGEPGGEAARLLSALAPDAPKSVDLLAAQTGLPPHRVLALLLELQMAGHALELPGMRYARASARR